MVDATRRSIYVKVPDEAWHAYRVMCLQAGLTAETVTSRLLMRAVASGRIPAPSREERAAAARAEP